MGVKTEKINRERPARARDLHCASGERGLCVFDEVFEESSRSEREKEQNVKKQQRNNKFITGTRYL